MASSLLHRKDPIQALMPTSGVSSVIRDIEKIKVIDTIERLDGTKIDVVKENEEFLYEIFFDIDLSKIVTKKILELKYVVLNQKPVTSLAFFQGVGLANPVSLVTRLYGQRGDNFKQIAASRRESTVGKGTIDLRRYISDLEKVYKNLKVSKSEAEIYGKVKFLKQEIVGDLIKKGFGNTAVSQMQFPTVKTDHPGDRNFANPYIKSLNNGADPGSAFSTIKNVVRPELNSISTKIVNYSSRPGYTRNEITNVLRSRSESITSPPISRVSQLGSTGKDSRITVQAQRVNKVRTIAYRVKIPSRAIMALDSFTFRVSIIDPETQLTMQNMDILIPHRINVENYYVPDQIPRVKIGKRRFKNPTSQIIANVDNIGKKVKNVKLFTRRIPSNVHLSYCPFESDKNIESKIVKNQECYSFTTKSRIRPSEATIVRACPESVAGYYLSNFTSDIVSGDNFHYCHASLYALNDTGGVRVSFNMKNNDIAAGIVYKKGPGDKDYIPINTAYLTKDKTPVDIMRNTSGRRVTACIWGEEGGTKDHTARDGDIISYKLRLFPRTGADFFYPDEFSIQRDIPLKYIAISTQNLQVVSQTGAAGKREFYDADSTQVTVPVAINFKIDFNIIETSTDLILKLLRSIGNQELFAEDFGAIKDTLSDVTIFGITRINVTTGEVVFLGYHIKGDFSDDGTYGPQPREGYLYKYCIKSYITNTKIVASLYEISEDSNTGIIKTIEQVKIPSNIVKMRNAAANLITQSTSDGIRSSTIRTSETMKNFTLKKQERNFSKLSLLKGIVPSVEQITQNYNIADYGTGDQKTFSVDLSKTKIGIREGVSITRSSTGVPILRFSAYAGSNSSVKMIDYGVITCVRDGQVSISGACHNDGTGKFIYADYLNSDYIGQVNYSVQFYLLTGERLPNEPLGGTMLIEQFPKLIKRERRR